MEIWSTRFIKIQNTASAVEDYKQRSPCYLLPDRLLNPSKPVIIKPQIIKLSHPLKTS